MAPSLRLCAVLLVAHHAACSYLAFAPAAVRRSCRTATLTQVRAIEEDEAYELLAKFDENSDDNDFDDDVTDVSDDDVEDLLFMYDTKGSLKPGSTRPSIERLQRELAGGATLVDARSAAAWQRASRADALHCPASAIRSDDELPAALRQLDKQASLFVFSGFDDGGADAAAAADALREKGFTDARALDESFEALQAQLPAA